MTSIKQCCPYCASQDLVFLKDVRETAMPGPTSYEDSFDNKTITITPVMCNSCQIGFNKEDLDEETRTKCFKRYEFIKPNSGVGESAFMPFLNLIKKHAKKDDKLLEIGCYDGFILKNLQKANFTHLTGYDPSCLITSNEAITIKKEYFTKDTILDEKVDGIIMGNVIEFIKDLHVLLDKCYESLNDNGKIYIEVPQVSAVHALQYYRFTLGSFDRIAKDHGFNLTVLETNVDDFYKNHHFNVIMQKRDANTPYTPFMSEDKFLSLYKEAVHLLSKSTIEKDASDRLSSLFINAINDNEIVHIYGSGNATFALLDSIDDDLVKKANIVLLDSDASRDGLFYKTPQNTLIKVHYAKSYLKDKHIKYLALGVFSNFFIKEIKDNLQNINCTYDNIFQTYL